MEIRRKTLHAYNELKSHLLHPKNTPRKFINFCFTYMQIKLIKNSKVIGFPTSLSIDPVNVCNLKCPLCPTWQSKEKSEKSTMSFELFKKVINELGRYLYHIDLYNWGEPFLNKEIIKMISYASDRRIEVEISSNLNILDNNSISDIVNSGLDTLVVSIAGASQKSYGDYNVGGDFKRVITTVKLIREARDKSDQKKPKLIWRFLVTRFNEKEISKAEQIHRSIGFDAIEFLPIHLDMGSEVTESVEKRIAKFHDWLPVNSKYIGYEIKSKKKNKQNFCDRVWRTSLISSNGDVFPCCAVYGDKYAFGNINQSKFEEIWNNKYYRSARNSILGKNKHEIHTVCDICKQNGYLDVSTI